MMLIDSNSENVELAAKYFINQAHKDHKNCFVSKTHRVAGQYVKFIVFRECTPEEIQFMKEVIDK